MLLSIALIFLLGMFLGRIFKKMKMPPLIGMLIAGIILGPYLLGLLDNSLLGISESLRTVALVIILARAGLSLELSDLKKIGRPAVLLSFIPAFFEMAGTMLIAPFLFDMSLRDAALLAAIIASASPAVITPRMIKLMEEGYGTDKNIPQMILAGDSVDDVLNIVIFTSLLGLSRGESISALSFAAIPVSIIAGILFGIIAGILLTFLFKKIDINATNRLIILLSTAFLFIGAENILEDFFPFSGLLPIMTTGVILLKSLPDTANKFSFDLSKLWAGAQIMLFALVGAGLDIIMIPAAGLKTILMLLATLSLRALGIIICLIGTNLNRKERLFCTFTGIPKATVQAAIGGIPLAMGHPSGEIILAVSVIAILFTAPAGAFIIDKTYKVLLAKSK